MSFQGISRTSPPICTGKGDPDTGEHCCWVQGDVCPLYVANDPRDTRPGAVHSCGLVLTLLEQFPNLDIPKIWAKVHRHPLYDRISAVWAEYGIQTCGNWMGLVQPDNTVIGQCCFKGYVFASDGTVISGPGG